MSTEKANKKINEIDSKLSELSENKKQQKAEINGNNDFTDIAKSKKIEAIDREYSNQYGTLQEQKKQVVTETTDSLAQRLYAGEKLTNPIQFDRAVNDFSDADDDQLISMLKQDPTSETKRAIYKAATTRENPSFNVLAEASEINPDDKGKIEDYFAWQQQWGALEDRTNKMERALFGGKV